MSIMKNMSFKSYLESRGAVVRLDEGLKEIKPMIWPDMDLYTAMIALQNSPTWTPAQMRGKMDLSFKSGDDREAFIQFVASLYGTAFGSSYSEDDGWDMSAWLGKLITLNAEKSTASSSTANVRMSSPIRQDGEDDKSYRKRSDQKFSSEFGAIMAVMKIVSPESMRYVRHDKSSPGTVVISTDDEATAAKVFRTIRYVEGLSDEELKAVLAQKKIDDGKFTAAASDEEIKSELKFKRSDAVQTLIIESYFNGLFKCYEIYDYFRKGGDKSPAGRDKYVQSMRPTELKPLLMVPSQLASGTQMAMTHSEYVKHADGFENAVSMTADIDEVSRWLLKMTNQLLKPGEAQKQMDKLSKERAFLEDQIKKAGSANEKQRFEDQLSIVQTAYKNAEDASKLTPENLQDYLDSKHIGSVIARYESIRNVNIADMAKRKAQAKEKNVPFDEQAEKKKIPEPIINLKSFDQMLSPRMRLDGQNENPAFGNACAERRMKLFAAARAKGAVVWTSRNWVICKITNKIQSCVFGRNKPKVEPGTNNIITAANLEDREGITERNRAIRDGGGAYVKDGIGTDRRMQETGWCTASQFFQNQSGIVPWEHTDTASNVYWLNGMRLIIMDCRDGRLYQLGNPDFRDEDDNDRGGIIAATGMTGRAAYNRIKQAYPELDALITRSGVEDIMFRGMNAASPESLFAEAFAADLITRTGGIILDGAASLRRYYPILYMVSEIIVLGPTARQMFASAGGLTRPGIMQFPPIDCRRVIDATEMFCGANTTKLILRNTDGIKNMRRMFYNSRINSIEGLDTSNATDITEMFCNCRLIVYKFMYMPEFDLKSCEKMDRAFSGSAMRFIHLRNTDKVQTAVDAFNNCFMLENVPEATFPLVTSGSQLASAFKITRDSSFGDDFSKIFAGCAKLPRVLTKNNQDKIRAELKSKLDAEKITKEKYQEELAKLKDYGAQMDALKQWYVNREKTEKTGRDPDVLVVNSQSDLIQNKDWLYEYKVVKLGKCDVENLFYGMDGLRIKMLDVNGHEHIDFLFSSCEIQQIDEIIGTENVKTAKGMFSYCSLQSPPAMQLPALTGEMNVFYNMRVPLGMPYVEFGLGIKPFDNLDYTNDQNHTAICRRMFGDNSSEWIAEFEASKCVQTLFQNMYEANQEKMLKNLTTDERGYLVVTDDMAQQLAGILTIKKDVPGVILRFEMPESGKGLFMRKNLTDMPKIDFENRAIDCENMFRECVIAGKWGGLENTKNVELAVNMFFKTATPKSEVLPFDVSGIKRADYMFYEYTPREGAKIGGNGEWDFKSIESGTGMFQLCSMGVVIDRVLFGEKLKTATQMFTSARVESTKGANCVIKMPTVVACDGMFMRTQFAIPKIKEISLDSATLTPDNSGMGLFEASTGCAEITELNLPETVTLDNAFAQCKSIVKVFTINAPKAKSAQNMFIGCDRFGGAMIWESPISKAQGMCINSLSKNIYGINGEYLIAKNRLLAKRRI